MKQQMRSSLLLLTAAFIWGVAFVAQSVGLEHVGTLTLNGSRFLLGGLVLIPFIHFRNRRQKAERENRQVKNGRMTVIGGICCGVVLCIASTLQQSGLQHTTVGKAGFITALYIVLVPIIGLFLGKKASPLIWIGTLLAMGGFYLLCMNEGFSINGGDLLLLAGAFSFSIHILVIDHFAPVADPVVMSCVQFWVTGFLCTVGSFLFESPSWERIAAAAIPILYAGILSSGVAFTLQIVGQAGMNPAVACMILSLESVIAVLAGWVILGEVLTPRQLGGCVLVFLAVILAQIPFNAKKE